VPHGLSTVVVSHETQVGRPWLGGVLLAPRLRAQAMFADLSRVAGDRVAKQATPAGRTPSFADS
jgi:hypothetical protein